MWGDSLNSPLEFEEAIKQALSKYGACVIALHVTGSFFYYKGGIYDAMVNGQKECPDGDVNQ